MDSSHGPITAWYPVRSDTHTTSKVPQLRLGLAITIGLTLWLIVSLPGSDPNHLGGLIVLAVFALFFIAALIWILREAVVAPVAPSRLRLAVDLQRPRLDDEICVCLSGLTNPAQPPVVRLICSDKTILPNKGGTEEVQTQVEFEELDREYGAWAPDEWRGVAWIGDDLPPTAPGKVRSVRWWIEIESLRDVERGEPTRYPLVVLAVSVR